MALSTSPNEQDRWQEIIAYWERTPWLWIIPGIGIGIVIGLRIPLDLFIDGIWPEILSTIFTVVVIDQLYRRRDERNRIKELKARLVREAGGQSNEAAKRAVDELRANGWLEGENGLLRGADLYRANLGGANLRGANLEGANLMYTNLEYADLLFSNLKGAIILGAKMKEAWVINANLERITLIDANLESSDLRGADLTGANLTGANLRGSILFSANLKSAKLYGANLRDAYLGRAELDEAIFDEDVTLPDGNKWTPETDMMQFTDLRHPKFWPADFPASPAYKGED